jgi:hypothetical protein
MDISDGFYRLKLSSSGIPSLGVAFPTTPSEEPLVAFPLVLPMGWVSSPPFFCALTESIANVTNNLLKDNRFYPLSHPLSNTADNPSDLKLVSWRSAPLPVAHLTALPAQPSPRRKPPSHSCTVPIPVNCLTAPLVLPRPLLLSHTQPLQRFVQRKLLAYVDLYMDDFLGLAQGHPKLWHRVRDTIFHDIDAVFCPNDSLDDGTPRKEPISLSKLQKGNALWATRKVMLGWIIDTVAETIELPDHRAEQLSSLLNKLLALRCISIKRWQKALGELRSMVLAILGGGGVCSAHFM